MYKGRGTSVRKTKDRCMKDEGQVYEGRGTSVRGTKGRVVYKMRYYVPSVQGMKVRMYEGQATLDKCMK